MQTSAPGGGQRLALETGPVLKGDYEIWARWPADVALSEHAVFQISAANVILEEVILNQKLSRDLWFCLGTFPLRDQVKVTLYQDAGQQEALRLDAVRLIGVHWEDADADGLPDSWEEKHGLDTTRNDAHEDPDLDGGDNLRELWFGTDPRTLDSAYAGLLAGGNPGADSDSDGLSDAVEKQIIDSNSRDAIRTLADVKPNEDFDGDGISNLQEFTEGSEINNPGSNSRVLVRLQVFTRLD